MTIEEAIELLEDLDGAIEDNHGRDYDEAFRMAIESLQSDAVPIQEVKLKDGFKIDEIPQDYKPKILGNVEVVVRCKDCKWKTMYYNDNESFYCDRTGIINMHIEDGDDEFWCKYGERKGGEDE